MTSPFENLAGPGKPLKAEPADAKEFAGLVRSGKARLKDAGSKALALESRFDLAYNAAHAALRWHGYRSQNRYLVFQCLQHTLELPNEQWRVLDSAHRKRNLAEYEGDLDVDAALVGSVVRVAHELERRLLLMKLPQD